MCGLPPAQNRLQTVTAEARANVRVDVPGVVVTVDSAAASVNAVVPPAARDKAKQRIAHSINFVLI